MINPNCSEVSIRIQKEDAEKFDPRLWEFFKNLANKNEIITGCPLQAYQVEDGKEVVYFLLQNWGGEGEYTLGPFIACVLDKYKILYEVVSWG